MPVTINVKKFSRSKIAEPIAEEDDNISENFNGDIIINQQTDDIDQNQNEPIDLLADLNNDVFVPDELIEQQQKLTAKQQKEMEKEEKRQLRIQKQIEQQQQREYREQQRLEKEQEKQQKQKIKQEDDDLFDEHATELYGRDRLQLIAKINQYKILFPDNEKVQKLKIPKKASVEILQQYVSECECYVEVDNIETFITDSILQAIKVGETISQRTKYNITGLANDLKANPHFNSLTKQLYLKYKVFSKIPPEYQLLFIVFTTANMCYEKNKQMQNINNIANQQIDPNNF